jgi:hypothetical protein
VRWGPQEDDKEQDERLEPDGSGCRRPTNHWRKSAGGATNDNVLRRPALQPDRIHGDIEEDREGEQRRGYDVERQGENGDCAACEGESESKRFGPRDFAVRDRTPGRARHHGVDVGVVPHVEHTGRAGARGNANKGNCSEQRIDVAWGDEQADGGRTAKPSRVASSAINNTWGATGGCRRETETLCLHAQSSEGLEMFWARRHPSIFSL